MCTAFGSHSFNFRTKLLTEATPRPRGSGSSLDDENLRYKLINRAESSPNDYHAPILTGIGTADSGKERAADTSQSDLLPWFGSRLVATGYQRLRSERGPDREVFFLNSVVFQRLLSM